MLRVNGKTDYFYLYNGLGDVTSLVDSSNQVVVRYQYNSWGKATSTQDTSGVSLATLNPFCYRKYVYDPEIGLYCLQEKKEVVLLPKEKDLKREKLRKKPQNEQIKPRIQLQCILLGERANNSIINQNKNSHDHFYFPKRFWVINMFVKYKKYKDDDKNDE